MPTELRAFARAIEASQIESEGFQATQALAAGPIQATARVLSRKPNLLLVEYRSYKNPLLELEEQLVNGAELTPDEIEQMTFAFDGKETVSLSPATHLALRRMGFTIPEPMPGYRAVGELGFLRRLTQDYLLRDEHRSGDPEEGVRRIGIKPKASVRSELLSVTSFPFVRASLLVDAESLFPRSLDFQPSSETMLATLLGPHVSVSITYTDLIAAPPEADRFEMDPPEGTRQLTETVFSPSDLPGAAPFPCSLEPLQTAGFEIAAEGVRLTADEANTRGFLITTAVAQDASRNAAVTVRMGNYLSGNMGRRRAALSEKGTRTTLAGVDGWILDRTEGWPSGVSPDGRSILEIGWEMDGIYGFLLGEGVGQEELSGLAEELIGAMVGGPEAKSV